MIILPLTLQTNENSLDISALQKQCPDFKHIYNYLAENELSEDEKLKRTVLVEKEYYNLVDSILIHRFQPRSKKKPIEEKIIFQTALPKALRLKVSQEFHDGNGHFALRRHMRQFMLSIIGLICSKKSLTL